MRRAPSRYGRGVVASAPSLRVEKRLLRDGHRWVVCIDEVGRGALGGPATAGVVVIDATVRRPLTGVRDSKLLGPSAREALVERIERWAVASAVGHASAGEVDAFGINPALRLAAHRAIAALPIAVSPDDDIVLLDGSVDWVSVPVQSDLLAPPPVAVADGIDLRPPPVITRVKADLSCCGVAAASVLAKVSRDAVMGELARAHPVYAWDANKGYASPAHIDGLRRFGPCEEHRRSWALPGVDGR